MKTLQQWKKQAKRLADSPTVRRWDKGVRAAFVVAVIVWLFAQLASIGWQEVWASRPSTPWFYVLWGALYLQLPFVEVLIYRTLWGVPVREGLVPILRKRALNQDVVSYSGEAYFFVWAKQHLDLPDAKIAGTLKDNAIASSLGSWTAAILVVGGFLLTGQIVLTDLVGNQDPLYVSAGVFLFVSLMVLGIRFRQTLFTLSPRAVAGLFGAHFGRFILLIYSLRILQWWVVLPEAPLSVWATILAVTTFINRLPLIPAKDLVGIGAVLGMTGLFATSGATIAAMLLVHSALTKAANFMLFTVVSVVERRREEIAPPAQEQAPSHPVREKESVGL